MYITQARRILESFDYTSVKQCAKGGMGVILDVTRPENPELPIVAKIQQVAMRDRAYVPGERMCDVSDFAREIQVFEYLESNAPNLIPRFYAGWTQATGPTDVELGFLITEKWTSNFYELIKMFAHHLDAKTAMQAITDCAVKIVRMLRHLNRLGIMHYDSRACNVVVRGKHKNQSTWSADTIEFALIDFGMAQIYRQNIIQSPEIGWRASYRYVPGYDIAHFQFDVRGVLQEVGLDWRLFSVMSERKYKTLVKTFAKKDEWLPPGTMGRTYWIDQQLN